MACRFSSPRMAPPPVESTTFGSWHSSAMACRSLARNPCSPSSAKSRSMGTPARSTIHSSASTKRHPRVRATRRPTAVLPVPEKPVRMMLIVT